MDISAENIRLIFGLKLKELRNEHGFSLSVLSIKSGISKSYLNEIEKGKKYPKPDKIIRLAEIFNVSYEFLVSLELSKRLSPISDLIRSNILSELPLDFFGVEPIDLLTLLSAAPTKFSAFVDAIIQIGIEHNIRVESLYFSVLRSYQEMHDNYFPEIEKEAKKIRKKYNIDGQGSQLDEILERILTKEFNYRIIRDEINKHKNLASVRYIYIDGKKPGLLLNKHLDSRQRLFIMARELGINIMGLSPRNYTPSWIDSQSFSHVLNNFKAYYFAVALILDERIFTKGLVDFTKREQFQSEDVLELMRNSSIHAEPFMLRITNLVPRYFRFSQLFFTRYNELEKDKSYKLTKVLHGSGLSKSSASSLEIKACQRWAALESLSHLHTISKSSKSKSICTVYELKFEEDKNRYLIISVAQSMLPTTGMNNCISVGFLINKRFEDKTNFLNSSTIKKHTVTSEWIANHDMNVEDGLNKTELREQGHSIKLIKKEIGEIIASHN